MPGKAPIRPPTTRCKAGTAVTRRSSRSTRSARNTEKAEVAGASASPTTVTSKMFHPVAEEGAALHDQAGQDLQYEYGDDDAVDHREQRAEARHDGWRLSPARA